MEEKPPFEYGCGLAFALVVVGMFVPPAIRSLLYLAAIVFTFLFFYGIISTDLARSRAWKSEQARSDARRAILRVRLSAAEVTLPRLYADFIEGRSRRTSLQRDQVDDRWGERCAGKVIVWQGELISCSQVRDELSLSVAVKTKSSLIFLHLTLSAAERERLLAFSNDERVLVTGRLPTECPDFGEHTATEIKLSDATIEKIADLEPIDL